MKISIKVQKITTLVLTEAESKWLKQLMQNPIHQIHPDDESTEDKEMRQTFWNALNNNK